MKALIKFLLTTGVGRAIVQTIISAALNLFRKRVMEKMEPYKRENLNEIFRMVDSEIHADVLTGRIKVTDVL